MKNYRFSKRSNQKTSCHRVSTGNLFKARKLEIMRYETCS